MDIHEDFQCFQRLSQWLTRVGIYLPETDLHICRDEDKPTVDKPIKDEQIVNKRIKDETTINIPPSVDFERKCVVKQLIERSCNEIPRTKVSIPILKSAPIPIPKKPSPLKWEYTPKFPPPLDPKKKYPHRPPGRNITKKMSPIIETRKKSRKKNTEEIETIFRMSPV
ncbi:hypothetical protein NPIL_593222 [Nephila pilipes]|uniref:Uncharacterized protein n=1 Tax=Nephila pilipes TaxID=299642 RepID=A0A8X6PF77_NEPPI|nr:hypothetical protein NPIL_593222 [Nephila pilipes]